MKTVFASNMFTPHQKPLSDALAEMSGSFVFLETLHVDRQKLPIGWRYQNTLSNYVRAADEDAQQDILAADMVIFGGAPDYLLSARHKVKRIVFRYSERFYKKGVSYWTLPLRFIKNYLRFGRYANDYLLCASGYTAADAARTCSFIGKTYKWGYFPETLHYDINELLRRKKRKQITRILWVGRMIGWKHPELAVEVAEHLFNKGYKFEMELIGSGDRLHEIEKMVMNKSLGGLVYCLGEMSTEGVRKHMEEADIFLFTSDFNEGWGAVLNEAMNSGCAVVASHAIGSVPFLLQNRKNGLIYKNGDTESLNNEVEWLLNNLEVCQEIGLEAYQTITSQWNAKVAAQRLILLSKEIQDHGYCDLFEDGPCSPAAIIKDNWFEEKWI